MTLYVRVVTDFAISSVALGDTIPSPARGQFKLGIDLAYADCRRVRTMKELLVVLAILHGGDAVSTQIGLHRGLREANPMLPQNPTTNLVVKSAYATAGIILLNKLSHKAPKLAKGLAIGCIVAESAAIGHNVRVIISIGGPK